MNMKIKEFADTELINIRHEHGSVFHPDDITSKVLGYFKDSNRYEAVASDGNNTGLITVRDLLGVTNPERTKVKNVWEQIAIADVHNSVLQIAEVLIDHSVRALPLTEGTEIKGIISQVDLLEEMQRIKELGSINVKDLMISPVVFIDSRDTSSRARREMLDRGISHLPVLRDNKLVGLVTAKLLVDTFIVPAARMTMGSKSGRKIPQFAGEVGGIMDSRPITVGPEANALNVIEEMIRMGKSACLILDNTDTVVGIITPRELLQPIYELREEEELPIYIIGLTADEDWFDTVVAENKIRRVVMRAQKMLNHVKEVRVNVERQRYEGNRTLYEVKAHLYSKQGGDTIHITQDGWDLLEAFDQLTESLNGLIRNEKNEPEKKPRRGRRQRIKPSDLP